MYVRDDIAMIRRDPASLEADQTALAIAIGRWRAAPDTLPARVLADLDRMVDGAPAAACPDLMRLFGPGGTAARVFTDSLMAEILPAMAAQPLNRVPVTHAYVPGAAMLYFGQAGAAVLLLTVAEASGATGGSPGQVVAFQPSVSHEVVLAGHAEGTLVTITGEAGPDAVDLERHPVTLAPGDVFSRDNRREALLLDHIAGQLVTLRLQREIPRGGLMREVDVDTGRILHRAAATAEESRRDLMIALLGRMGRSEAAPVLADLARGSDSPGLRWQALRECLGLDTATGFAALTAVARDAADPLAVPAGALRAQLVEAHPALETVPCPA